MDEIKLNKIHEIIDCMNDIGMLDSFWEEIIHVDILTNLDYWIRSKIDTDETRKSSKLINLLEEIEDLEIKVMKHE